MKFSKEAKIGLLVSLSLLIFFAGLYFLKGANLFSRENDYIVYYNDIQGLQPSAAVQVKGLAVGRVATIVLNEADGRVKVTLSVKNEIELPSGTIAKLISADLLGSKVISLELGAGKGILKDQAVIKGEVEGGVMDNLSYEIAPLIHDIRSVVTTLDTVLLGVNQMLGTDTREKLSSSLASLDETMKNLSDLSARLSGESAQLTSIIRNTNSITTNLAESNEQVKSIINNTQTISDKLADAPIDQVVKDLQATTAQVKGILNKINNNEGSLGMLVNDKQLYNELNATMKTLDALMADINAHPSRYINVTIFGRKNKNTH